MQGIRDEKNDSKSNKGGRGIQNISDEVMQKLSELLSQENAKLMKEFILENQENGDPEGFLDIESSSHTGSKEQRAGIHQYI